MPMQADDIIDAIKVALPDAVVELIDLAGDGDHYQVTVTSAQFAGKPRVAQHQMVYAAFGDKMGGVLHALSITTKTPI